MLVPLSWLKEYVDIVVPVGELTERLTLAGLEVTSISHVGDWWDTETILVGQVTAVLAHPNADRLVLVDVDYGGDEAQRVVTGAPNLYQFRGQSLEDGALPVLKVAFARQGAELVDAYSEKKPRPKRRLKSAKIRGVESSGMVCSERELGLSEEHEGIMILPENAPVGSPLRDYLGDVVIEIDLTPDMARALSIVGVAREVAALTGAQLHLPEDIAKSQGDDTVVDYVSLQIDEPQLCNRYVGILVKDVQIGPSPSWIQDRLRKAGMRPISNVVDITNYVMLEQGQPLHAFDYDILVERASRAGDETPTIIVKTAEAGEEFTTLDGVQHKLDDSMLMIADTAGSVAIAGVMGGLESEVRVDTRNILIEAATFEGINNRRTAQKLRLSTEASYRFARGVPATLNPLAARRASELMRLYAGGCIVPGDVDAYPVPQQLPTVYTCETDMERILGMYVSLDEIEESLRKLEFAVERVADPASEAEPEATFGLARKPGEELLACVPPWHRLDVRVPADLIEEVARMVGYDKADMTLLEESLPPQRRNEEWETKENIRDILVRSGLQEIINRTLTTPADHEKLAPGSKIDEAAFITLANPNAPERVALRRSMLVSNLENTARNLRYTDRLTTFEVGRVYLPEEGDGVLPLEDRRVCIVMCGPRQEPSFYTDGEEVEEMDFFDIKGVVETLLDELGYDWSLVEYKSAPETETFGPRCAEVWLSGERLGLMGEIHPQVRSAFGLPATRINATELRIQPMVRSHWQLDPMRPISVYPPVVEDLAFEVDEIVTNRNVVDHIQDAGGELLVEVELFDVYRGEPLPEGRKSLAYRLTYQSLSHSLQEKEVSAIRRRVIASVEKETGGKLRSM